MQRLETVHIDTLSATNFTPPANCIGDAAIPQGANIDPAKVGAQSRFVFAQDGAAADITGQCIGVVRGATGTIEEVVAGMRVKPVGDDKVRLRVRKGGVSILTTAIVLTSAMAVYSVNDGTILTSAVAHDNVLTVDVVTVHGTGTLPSGVFLQVLVHEDAL